ncbi:hypothetical protein [Flavobacterium sp.]|jgi:hypothetical protein|uniref:hypothetical protein n=1 Tax=Flavobacterium sp. TaxID=239 RepID=UPI0037C03EB4
MKKFLAVCLVFISSFAFAESANFTGNYPTSACSFTGSQDGVMGINPQLPLVWSTSATGGQAAVLNLAYIGDPTVSIDAVSGFTSTPGSIPSGTTYETKAWMNSNGAINSGNWFQTGNKTKQLSNAFYTDILYVDFATNFGSAPASGNYTASTTVTCM